MADQAPGTGKKLEDLYRLIDGIGIAMLTTRRTDGSMVSRPMAMQERVSEADLFFVTDGDTHKLDELEFDAHVNVSFYRDRTREWVSVSGTARISRDRELIRRLYKPDWKAWFGDEGGEHDGGPGDPRLTLVLVDATSVVYMLNDTPRPVVLFEVLKGMVTGSTPDVGEVRKLGESELHGG
jgi:general stress protein 26